MRIRIKESPFAGIEPGDEFDDAEFTADNTMVNFNFGFAGSKGSCMCMKRSSVEILPNWGEFRFDGMDHVIVARSHAEGSALYKAKTWAEAANILKNYNAGFLRDDDGGQVPNPGPTTSNGSWVGDRLRHMASIYDQRNALYGDNYKHFGEVMAAMFPDGLTLSTVDDWNRIGVFVQAVAKKTRYASMFMRGGHEDSLDDDGVYSTMLNELDAEIKARKKASDK